MLETLEIWKLGFENVKKLENLKNFDFQTFETLKMSKFPVFSLKFPNFEPFLPLLAPNRPSPPPPIGSAITSTVSSGAEVPGGSRFGVKLVKSALGYETQTGKEAENGGGQAQHPPEQPALHPPKAPPPQEAPPPHAQQVTGQEEPREQQELGGQEANGGVRPVVFGGKTQKRPNSRRQGQGQEAKAPIGVWEGQG